MTTTAGADAAIQLGMESRNGNRRVRIEIEFPGCDESRLGVPGAIVRGQDDRRIAARASVVEDGRVTWSQGVTLQGETTLRGVVADDAKLDFMEPHNTEQATLTLGGSSRGFEPMTLRTLVQRITRVNMRTGEYVLGPSIVDVSISSRGFEGAERRSAEADIVRKMRSEADKQFRDIIDKAIRRFRAVEDAWQVPNACATIELTPASNTKTLHRGDTGTVVARTLAKPGGAPGSATWTLVSSANAPFSPGAPSANPATITHGAVTDAARHQRVRHVQVGLEGGRRPGHLDAADRGPRRQHDRGDLQRHVGIRRVDLHVDGQRDLQPRPPRSRRQRRLQAHRGVVHGDRLGHGRERRHHMPAVGHQGDHDDRRGPDGGRSRPARTAPYDYSGSVISLGPQPMTVTLSSCPDPDSNGTQVVVGLPFTALDTQGNRRSADGLDFTGASSSRRAASGQLELGAARRAVTGRAGAAQRTRTNVPHSDASFAYARPVVR